MKQIYSTKKIKLFELESKIYLITAENKFNLNWHFLRVQEFYESENSKIRNHSFDIFDFIEYYCEFKKSNDFTYVSDWAGFNVPSYVFDKAFKNVDLNKFDKEMIKIDKFIRNYQQSDKYYLIGTLENADSVLNHELAHAYFYLYPKYKKEMLSLVDKLSKKTYRTTTSWFKDIGYTEKVYKDELQAYISTDLYFYKIYNVSKKLKAKFDKVFQTQKDLNETTFSNI